MTHNWWKILSAVLVILAVVVGLKTPLSPGIPSTSPDRLNSGVTSVQIKGYNTHFTSAEESLSIWVTNGESRFCPYEMTVLSDTEIRASFSVTGQIQEAFFDLYVSNSRRYPLSAKCLLAKRPGSSCESRNNSILRN